MMFYPTVQLLVFVMNELSRIGFDERHFVYIWSKSHLDFLIHIFYVASVVGLLDFGAELIPVFIGTSLGFDSLCSFRFASLSLCAVA